MFNGDPDISGNSGAGTATAPSHADTASIGAGYDFGDVYLGASVLKQRIDANDTGIFDDTGEYFYGTRCQLECQ